MEWNLCHAGVKAAGDPQRTVWGWGGSAWQNVSAALHLNPPSHFRIPVCISCFHFGYLPRWELLNFLVPLLSGSWEWLAAFNIQICSLDNSLLPSLLIKYLVLTLHSSGVHFYLVLCWMKWVKRWGRRSFGREVKGNLILTFKGSGVLVDKIKHWESDQNCKMWKRELH